MKIINRNKETIMGKYDYPINHVFSLNNNTYVVKRSNLNLQIKSKLFFQTLSQYMIIYSSRT